MQEIVPYGDSRDKRKINTVQLGYQLGEVLTSAYASQPNPQPVYINNRRVHHGTAGAIIVAVSLIAGIASKDEDVRALAGAGLGLGIKLMEDDIADLPEWFAFKTREKELDLGVTGLLFGNDVIPNGDVPYSGVFKFGHEHEAPCQSITVSQNR